mgnify:CR=1 FL=1
MVNVKTELKTIYQEATQNELHTMRNALVEFASICIEIINKDNENTDTNGRSR